MAMIPSLILAATALTLAAIPHAHRASAEPKDAKVTSEFVLPCEAEVPRTLDSEAADLLAELLGAPVFAAGGREIGNVVDISFDEEGRATRLLVTTEVNLGFGTRTVRIPIGTFIVLCGAVVLVLTPEQVRRLPDDRCYRL